MDQRKIKIINGGELIAQAALDSGVDFFSGYPITPANAIYTSMLKNLQSRGKVGLGVVII